MANPDQPRRRFAPVPIETTFQSVRKSALPSQARIGPNPELTPEPSPRLPSPHFHRESESRERRRFAPQLIESSRRSRRVGDFGPATRPADKTDITPYTNHIYSAKSKPNRRQHGYTLREDEILRPVPPTRRESEEEGVKEYLLELAAKEAARQMEEAALAAFPNSQPREGGVAHFYFRDGSESENSPEGSPKDEDFGQHRLRRKSSNLGLNWWHKHMQEHAMLLAHDRGEDEAVDDSGDGDDDGDDDDIIIRSDSDLDRMELPSPPDPMWTTTKPLSSADHMGATMDEMRLALNEANRHAMTQAQARHADPFSQSAPTTDGAPKLPYTPLSCPPESGRQNRPIPFGRPFGGFRLPPDDHTTFQMRKAVSPPMLGTEISFRTCPSPKLTKLETDHSFESHLNEEQNRDLSGQGGLWRGYCCRSGSTGGCIVPSDLHNPKMIVTPYVPGTPLKPCMCDVDSHPTSGEPASLWSSSGSSETASEPGGLWSAKPRQRSIEPRGLHMLHGLNERLQREKARAERSEKILLEFDELFVTQVYNYLSLGYPAMAYGFDEELSRISRVSVDDLRRDDEKQMAKGHMVDMKLEETLEDDKCPRWLALRTYVTEWAMQHPDLDNPDPLAWGVRERRGSWAI